MPIPHDRVIALDRTGIYESHYLKANGPDGQKAFWIKHTLFRPLQGPAVAELWFVWFQRGRPTRVTRMDVPWERLALSDGPRIDAGLARLAPDRAEGELGGIRWDLTLSGGLPPLLHLGSDWLYRGPFPKKKILTPVPGLRFDGRLWLDGQPERVESWIGLRGHNWGSEHALTYAYGNCNDWEDGVERALDGFTARIRLLGRPSPPLTALCVRAPEGDRDLTRPWLWLHHGQIEDHAWHVRRPSTHLMMRCEPADMVGLRYNQPRGGEHYCYNGKFAQVSLRLGPHLLRSSRGELETFFAAPLPRIPLHPPASWAARDGVYDSVTR
jgi:hypothetical protein